MYDIQKAMIWKRASAWLFDGIMMMILAVGIAFSLSALLGYDAYSQTLELAYDRYEQEYGCSLELTQQEYEALPPERQAAYQAATEALIHDEQANLAYSRLINLALTISTLSLLLAHLALEFGIPLLFKNGQTLGKKIFSLGVVRPDGVRVTTVQMFIRAILGKYTIETMVPVLLALLIAFGAVGIVGTGIIAALALAQLILLFANRNACVIHDLLAGTVVVDLPSQRVFHTTEELLAYQKQAAAERSAREPY